MTGLLLKLLFTYFYFGSGYMFYNLSMTIGYLVPLPPIGDGSVYYHIAYQKILAGAVLAAAVLMLLRAAWLHRRHF